MDASLTQRAQELASEIAFQAKTVDDLNGLMRLMMKSALERMLNTEMDVHLDHKRLSLADADSARGSATPAAESTAAPIRESSQRRPTNRRNGRSKKTVQGDLGKVTLDTPRDRDGTFEPQVIPKHQRRLSGFDDKILSLYAKGMTTRDIEEIVREL